MARRPSKWHDFIGQKRPIRYVGRLIEGSKTLGRPIPSIALVGRSGCGKSCFARAIAQGYGSQLQTLSASRETTAAVVCGVLSNLQHADMLFVDNADVLGSDAQEVLYQAIDECKVPVVRDNGRLDRTQLVSVADFTLILATNQPGKLKPALQKRLEVLQFDPYSEEELRAIVQKVAEEEGVEITGQAAGRLAGAAQGSPRTIARLFELLRRLAPDAERYDKTHVQDLLDEEGIDHLGLWTHQREYLRVLAGREAATVSLDYLAAKLGCDIAYVRQIETYLVELGFVQAASSRGRRLTSEGQRAVNDAAGGELTGSDRANEAEVV